MVCRQDITSDRGEVTIANRNRPHCPPRGKASERPRVQSVKTLQNVPFTPALQPGSLCEVRPTHGFSWTLDQSLNVGTSLNAP